MNKTLDESAELFDTSFMSCQQIESEMQQNPDANPYQGFFQSSKMDKWSEGAQNNEVAADVDEEIKTNPAEPILWIGGERFGTPENPIQINRDLVVAGYNIMIGRTGDVSVTAPPIGAMANEPIVQIWPNPEAAGRWIQEVIGEKRVVLKNQDIVNDRMETRPGEGLRPKVEELELLIRVAFTDVYERNDYTLLNHYPSTLRISGALVDGLRSLPPGEAAVMMDRLISEMAVNEVQERMFLIRQMLDTGLMSPDVSASTGGPVADQYVRNTSYPGIRARLAEIHEDLELKQRTLNRTTISILNRARDIETSGKGNAPSVSRGDDFLNN